MSTQPPPALPFPGTPEAEYKANVFRFTAPAMILLLALVMGYLTITGQGNIPLQIIIGLGSLGLGVYFLRKSLNERGMQVFVFPEGLVQIKKGVTEAVKWDDIQAVYQETFIDYNQKPPKISASYTITYNRNQVMTFDESLENYIQLGNTIHQRVSARLLPQSIERFEAGETMNFGKLVVNQEGLSDGKNNLPWQSFKDIRINTGALVGIEVFDLKADKWLSWGNFQIGDIPNFYVLQGIVKHQQNRIAS